MYKCFVKYPLVLLLAVFLFSCSSANNKPIVIRFSPDSTAVIFSDIDPAGLLQVKNAPGIDTGYNRILSVMETPSDDDSVSVEKPLPGKVRVTDSTVVFEPLTPFVPGKSYRVVSYMNVKFAGASMIWSGKLNQGVKSNQVLLKR